MSKFYATNSVIFTAMIRLLRLRINTTRPWMISSICYHSRGLEYRYCSSGDIDARPSSVYMTVYIGPRPILLLLLLAMLPARLYAAALLLYN